MLAHDLQIQEWVYGVLHSEPEPAGDFLKHFAQAVVRADADNYAAMRNSIKIIMQRFPKYKCTCQTWK